MTAPVDPVAAALIRTLRERRQAAGLLCPHCDSAHVVRWGWFRSRQRYRCRACRRSFSDLTDTPLRYLKRLDAWPAYTKCLSASRTVRAAAAHTRVATSTAFRWRHLILGAVAYLDQTQLSGLVEFAQTYLPFSTKGHRRGTSPRWEPSLYSPDQMVWARPGCSIVVACDRGGKHRAHCVNTSNVTGEQLRHLFDQTIAGNAVLLCTSGRYGPYARLLVTQIPCRRRLVQVSRANGDRLGAYHNENARLWIRRLLCWLPRFRGVATRYMQNYLGWRGMLDLVESCPWLTALIPCLPRPPSPTIPDNTSAERAEPS
jgi:transposase-like protein